MCLSLAAASCGSNESTQVSELKERIDQLESDFVAVADTTTTTIADPSATTTATATTWVENLDFSDAPVTTNDWFVANVITRGEELATERGLDWPPFAWSNDEWLIIDLGDEMCAYAETTSRLDELGGAILDRYLGYYDTPNQDRAIAALIALMHGITWTDYCPTERGNLRIGQLWDSWQTSSLAPAAVSPAWIAIMASLPADEYSQADAERELESYTAAAGLNLQLLLSDDYESLNPGYWVIYASDGWTDDESAAAFCTSVRDTHSLVSTCYHRLLDD